MKKNLYIVLLILCVSALSRKQIHAQDNTPFADENVDDLEDVSDAFQETFFEALKQKGIQNHDLAVKALNKCIRLEPKRAYLYFERAKNYIAQKQYDSAEEDLIKALELKPNQRDITEMLYDTYYKVQDFEKAEATVKKLITFDSQYKEDLARIYMRTKKYDEALVLLDELDEEKGADLYRQRLRTNIYKVTGNTSAQTNDAEAKIAANPENESEYLKLIFLYSEQGNTQKAYETALKLQKINPKADEVQLALYKFNLEEGKVDEAVTAMGKVLRSTRLDPKAKLRVLNDFLMFVNKNPSYESQLESAIEIFDTQVADANIYRELATYFSNKNQKDRALPYLEKALASSPDNLELIKSTVLLEIETQQFEKAASNSAKALELFPSQPLLYLTQGVALNKLGKHKEALDPLETGVDYVIDNPKMEADFYQQIGEAFVATGDTTQGTNFLNRAKALKAQID